MIVTGNRLYCPNCGFKKFNVFVKNPLDKQCIEYKKYRCLDCKTYFNHCLKDDYIEWEFVW